MPQNNFKLFETKLLDKNITTFVAEKRATSIAQLRKSKTENNNNYNNYYNNNNWGKGSVTLVLCVNYSGRVLYRVSKVFARKKNAYFFVLKCYLIFLTYRQQCFPMQQQSTLQHDKMIYQDGKIKTTQKHQQLIYWSPIHNDILLIIKGLIKGYIS